jgi:chemotaxis protein methyltransferase CheR
MVEPLTQQLAAATREDELAQLELTLLLEAILRFSGHDFTDYAQVTLKRRVAERMRAENVQTISGLQERMLHDPEALARFVLAMSGGHGRLFADPVFFRVFRKHVVPLLRTYTFTRIWVPNCAGGEDAYSIAVLLYDEGLLERAMIYATEVSDLAIAGARSGIFHFDPSNDPRAAYASFAEGTALSDSCEIGDGELRFGENLKRHIIFAQHSLITDSSLNEFHVILARGALRQFNHALQFRVHNLFLNSLIRLGFLCLGAGESLRLTPHERVFRRLSDDAPIYRRMR